MRTQTVSKTKRASIGLNLLLMLGLVVLAGLVKPSYTMDSEAFAALAKVPQETVPEQSTLNPNTSSVCGGSELRWLACAIYFEARNQSTEGQRWVAHVVLNRVADPRWPKTIEAVVRQGEEKPNRCQFSFMCDGKPERITDKRAWEQAETIARQAMQEVKVAKRPTCAHSYHANYVTSESALRWFTKLQTAEQVGSHIFYCDRTSLT